MFLPSDRERRLCETSREAIDVLLLVPDDRPIHVGDEIEKFQDRGVFLLRYAEQKNRPIHHLALHIFGRGFTRAPDLTPMPEEEHESPEEVRSQRKRCLQSVDE